MTDIIARAQKLMKDRKGDGSWDVVFAIHQDAERAAFSRTAISALAEEKFVYSVQVFMSGRWIFMVTLNTGNSLEEAGKWFPMKERAEYFASLWEPDTPARVVRRRVSPVVVDG